MTIQKMTRDKSTRHPADRPTRRPRKRNVLGARRAVKIAPAPARYLEELFHVQAASQQETGRNRYRVLLAMAVAMLVLGIFNSAALVNWVRSLPSGPIENSIIETAEAWHDWMRAAGLSDFIELTRDFITGLKNT